MTPNVLRDSRFSLNQPLKSAHDPSNEIMNNNNNNNNNNNV